MNYTDENRGKIQNRERARQIIDFHGIRYGNITPTDVDGMIEYHDKAFLFFEYKFKDAQIPHGQKLALRRLADCCNDSGKPAVVIVAEHNVSDCDADVNAAVAICREIYYHGNWYPCNKAVTAKQVADSFIAFVDK